MIEMAIKKRERDRELNMKIASLTTFAVLLLLLLLFYSLNGIFVAALFLRESAVLPS